MANSPQAGLPNKRSDRQLLEALSTPLVSTGILPVNLIVVAGEALPKQNGTAFRVLQNCGTVPVKFLIDNENNCTRDNFHGILSAGVAQDDGMGGIINFDKVGDRITVFVDSGSVRVATFVGTHADFNQG
jgi:hypothetical protein